MATAASNFLRATPVNRLAASWMVPMDFWQLRKHGPLLELLEFPSSSNRLSQESDLPLAQFFIHIVRHFPRPKKPTKSNDSQASDLSIPPKHPCTPHRGKKGSSQRNQGLKPLGGKDPSTRPKNGIVRPEHPRRKRRGYAPRARNSHQWPCHFACHQKRPNCGTRVA